MIGYGTGLIALFGFEIVVSIEPAAELKVFIPNVSAVPFVKEARQIGSQV